MRQDGEVFALFAVAETLGRTIGELGSMPSEEFDYWMAYLRVKAEASGGGRG